MNKRRKNKKEQTFNVYPHLSEYQYTTGIPEFKNAGEFFTYDDYLTNTLPLAAPGDEIEVKNLQNPSYNIDSKFPNHVKEGHPDFVPLSTLNNANSAISGMFNVLNAGKNFGTYLKDKTEGKGNINPATGLPYTKADFMSGSITNTTNQNVLIDAAGIKNMFDEDGNIIENMNTADNLFMTQQEAHAGYFNQLADYHSDTFIDENEFLADGTTPNPNYNKPLLSKQQMNKDGSKYYSNLNTGKKDESGSPDEFLVDGTTPNPDYNPNHGKPIMRNFTKDDLTKGDVFQHNVKDINVNRFKQNEDGDVTTFTGIDKTTGLPYEEEYDPNKNYGVNSSEEIINVQENLRRGGDFPRNNLQAFVNGGFLPKAQKGGGSLNDVFDPETGQYINGWTAENIHEWKSERGYSFDELLQFMAFTQTTPDGVAVDQGYGNRSNVPFDWDGENFGVPNQEYMTNYFRNQMYPNGAPHYEDPRFNKGNAYGNISDFDLTGWTNALSEYNDFSLGNMDERFGDFSWYQGTTGTDRAAYDKTFGMAYDADAHNFFWQGMPYTRETKDDNIFEWKDQQQIKDILSGIINISSKSGLGTDDPFLDQLIADENITDPETIYNKLLNHYKSNDKMDQYRLLRDLKKDNPEGYLDDLLMGDQSITVNKLRNLQNEALLTEEEGINEEYYDEEEEIDTDSLFIYDEEGNYVSNPNHYFKQAIDNTSGYGEWGYGVGGNSLSGTGITASDVAEQEVKMDPYAGFNTEYINQLNAFENKKNNKLYQYFNSKNWNKGPGSYDNFSSAYDLKNVANERRIIGETAGLKGDDLQTYLDAGSNPNTGNPVIDNLIKGANNQVSIWNLGNSADVNILKTPTYSHLYGLISGGGDDYDLNKMEVDDMSYFVEDMASSAIKNKLHNNGTGTFTDPDYNYVYNRDKTWYERNIEDGWQSVMDWADEPGHGGGFTQLPLSIFDWAGGIPNSVGRTLETPNAENLIRTGTDALSFLPPVRAYSMLTRPLALAAKYNKGTKWGKTPFMTNVNKVKTNYADDLFLKQIDDFSLKNTFPANKSFYNPATGTEFSGVSSRIGGRGEMARYKSPSFWNPTGGDWGITPNLSLKSIPYFTGLTGVDLYNQTQVAPNSSTTNYVDDVFSNPYEESLLSRYRNENPNSILNQGVINENTEVEIGPQNKVITEERDGGQLPKAQPGVETDALRAFRYNRPIYDVTGRCLYEGCSNREYDASHDFSVGLGFGLGKQDQNYMGDARLWGGYSFNPEPGSGSFRGAQEGLAGYLGANIGGSMILPEEVINTGEGDAEFESFANAVATLGYKKEWKPKNDYLAYLTGRDKDPLQLGLGAYYQHPLIGDQGPEIGGYVNIDNFNFTAGYIPGQGMNYGLGFGIPIRKDGGDLPKAQNGQFDIDENKLDESIKTEKDGTYECNGEPCTKEEYDAMIAGNEADKDKWNIINPYDPDKNISDVIIPDEITDFDNITANANVNELDPAIASSAGTYEEYLTWAGDDPYSKEDWSQLNFENSPAGAPLEVSWGDNKFDQAYNKLNAFTNTGAVGEARQLFEQGSAFAVNAASGFNQMFNAADRTLDNRINRNKSDEISDFGNIVESSRTDKGDFDFVTGDYRVNTLGYGDGPWGQIAQMGKETNAVEVPPNYEYLQQFLNEVIVGYNPEFLMTQAKDGSEIIDADMELIKQLMAAGADFEII